MTIQTTTESTTPAAIMAGDLPFAFERGQIVTHRDQPMLAVVTTRGRASNGLEVYGVVRLSYDCDVTSLLIGGDALMPVADDDVAAVAKAEAAWWRGA